MKRTNACLPSVSSTTLALEETSKVSFVEHFVFGITNSMCRALGSVPRPFVEVVLAFFGPGRWCHEAAGPRVSGWPVRGSGPQPYVLVIRRVSRTVVYAISVSFKNGKSGCLGAFLTSKMGCNPGSLYVL